MSLRSRCASRARSVLIDTHTCLRRFFRQFSSMMPASCRPLPTPAPSPIRKPRRSPPGSRGPSWDMQAYTTLSSCRDDSFPLSIASCGSDSAYVGSGGSTLASDEFSTTRSGWSRPILSFAGLYGLKVMISSMVSSSAAAAAACAASEASPSAAAGAAAGGPPPAATKDPPLPSIGPAVARGRAGRVRSAPRCCPRDVLSGRSGAPRRGGPRLPKGETESIARERGMRAHSAQPPPNPHATYGSALVGPRPARHLERKGRNSCRSSRLRAHRRVAGEPARGTLTASRAATLTKHDDEERVGGARARRPSRRVRLVEQEIEEQLGVQLVRRVIPVVEVRRER